MGKFSLENKIKDRLLGHEVHVDKLELWKALGIEEEEKDRKAIWFWWSAGLLGMAIVTGLWWFVQSDATSPKIVQETRIIAVDESVAKTGNETISETSPSQKLSKIIEDVQAVSENDRVDISSVQEHLKTNTSGAGSKAKMDKRDLPVENNKITNSHHLSNENNSGQTSSEMNEKLDADNAIVLRRDMSIIDRMPYIHPTLSYHHDLNLLFLKDTPLIKPVEKTRMFELELFGGIGTVDRTLSTTISELDGYVRSRDSIEGVLEHISAGASLKRFLGNGFYGKAGLTFNRWNENYSYNLLTDTIEETVKVPDVILFDLQGNQITSYIEGTRYIYNSEGWVRYNRLTQIDLPITLGYEYRMNRWSLFGEASGILNLKQLFRGYLNTFEGKEARNPNIFKSSVGINMGLSAGVGYGITPRWRARLSARYYKSLGSVLSSSTEINQKYSSVGIRMGIGYLF